MKLTVGYIPTDHKWLGLESLIRQKTDFNWELLIFDTDAEFYIPYIKRLQKANCSQIKVVATHRFEKYTSSKIIIIHTSDCYSHPTRLQEALSCKLAKEIIHYDCLVPNKGLARFRDYSNYTINMEGSGEQTIYKNGFVIKDMDPPYIFTDVKPEDIAPVDIIEKTKSINTITHFVYPYYAGTDGPIWKELFFSVRSIQKYFKGKYKIFIVGDNPSLKNVTHIPCNRITGVTNVKAFDAVNKLLKICESELINDDFIYMYDDIIYLAPLKVINAKKVIAHNYVDNAGTYFLKSGVKPDEIWIKFFENTINLLKQEDLSTYNYETHLPRYLNKEKIKSIINKYKLEENALLINTLYFNNYHKKPDVLLKDTPYIKAGFYYPLQEEAMLKIIKGKKILNYNDQGLSKHLRLYIQKLFM